MFVRDATSCSLSCRVFGQKGITCMRPTAPVERDGPTIEAASIRSRRTSPAVNHPLRFAVNALEISVRSVVSTTNF